MDRTGSVSASQRAFRDAGAEVTITGTKNGPEDYGHDLSGFGYEQLILSDDDSVARLAGALSRLDILVNNAGQNLPGARSEWEPDVFEDVLATNLTGTYRLTAACKRLLFASELPGGASVVNVGSMTSFFGLEVTPAYGASKAAIVQLTKGLAVAWARKGVRVNAVAPGLVESNMTRPMFEVDAHMAPILNRTPMRRVGLPDDIAPAVLFLSSDAAGYVTGQTLPIDGGFSVQG